MYKIEIIREFLGWCIVINIILMIISTILLTAFRGPISRIHGKIFKLDEKYLSRAYFQYLAHFKIAVIVFNIVPYFALMIIN